MDWKQKTLLNKKGKVIISKFVTKKLIYIYFNVEISLTNCEQSSDSCPYLVLMGNIKKKKKKSKNSNKTKQNFSHASDEASC